MLENVLEHLSINESILSQGDIIALGGLYTRPIRTSGSGPIELFLVPASAP